MKLKKIDCLQQIAKVYDKNIRKNPFQDQFFN